MIKVARIRILDVYLNNKRIKDKCSQLFDERFKVILADPYLSRDFRSNRTMIELRILVRNIAIAIKIIFYTIITLYFAGLFWLIFSLIFFKITNHGNEEEHFVDPIFNLTFKEKVL